MSLQARTGQARTSVPGLSRTVGGNTRDTRDDGALLSLEFMKGDKVQTADGEDVGRVDDLAIDPSTTEVTHLLVKKGFLFSEDRVVPVNTIDRVEDGNAILKSDVNPRSMREFSEKDFEMFEFVPEDDVMFESTDLYDAGPEANER